jgi:cellulose synthase/poly-beta-1,6-N-acetylglucosamine synthase-like glycosyltransferase
MILEIFFWICLLLVFHSYVLYPFILELLAKNIPANKIVYNNVQELPFFSILISAFNEQDVIRDKVESIYKCNISHDKFELIIGSDNSSDATNEILTELSKNYSNLIFLPFNTRQGKGNVINQLIGIAKGEIVVLTDANVMFDNNTLFELIKHFKNNKIGLVDTNMVNIGLKKEGISIQEKAYISREVKIKHNESKVWGTMMGPFGGCFAIRKALYEKVPSNFLVDDFYLNMKVYEKSYLAINNMNALVFEDVSNNIKEEFRRKIRIATGNFQNLAHFKAFLFHNLPGLSFCFISHKVIRWITPFLLIIAMIMLVLLLNIDLYRILLFLGIMSMLIPILDYLLKKINVHVLIFRFISHFYAMNLALLIGFIKYLKGVDTNVWKPTKRNQ